MVSVNYFQLIHKYIPPDSLTYAIYLPHVAAVTAKAIRIGCRLGLSKTSLRFIEEAAMLHDIGIVRVNAPIIGCGGQLPYLAHLVEGRKILEAEGYPQHAHIAECHVGVGIMKEEILQKHLPLPPRDFVPQTLEEQVISWADLFFGKHPGKLWREKKIAKVRCKIASFGERHLRVFDAWNAEFGDLAYFEGESKS